MSSHTHTHTGGDTKLSSRAQKDLTGVWSCTEHSLSDGVHTASGLLYQDLKESESNHAET